MLRVVDCRSEDVFALLRKRGVDRDEETRRVVAGILEDVRNRGDEALLESARRFDAPDLQSLTVGENEVRAARVPKAVLEAIDTALLQIQAFHAQQMNLLTQGWTPLELEKADARKRDGQPLHVSSNFEYRWRKEPLRRSGHQPPVRGGGVGQRLLPVRKAGVYVPGGRAAYPSSVLMNVIPALCAGVNAVFVATPAQRDGTLHPAVLAALASAGVAGTFKVGGAAAIAALAYGTETVPRVDVVVGPGNRFVNEAKRQLWGEVGLDGYAGPSEVCVLADAATNARFAAADLLTQIEHAPDNAGFLVCTDEAKLQEILFEIDRQVATAPRGETMAAALRDHSLAVVARDSEEACEVVDAIAPEHLTIATETPEDLLPKLRNAGCVLLGEWSPESAGDYAAGPSHTLPTAGAARWQSPVNVAMFLKFQSVIRLDREDLRELRPTIEALGTAEGFPAHALGATVRFEDETSG